MIFLKLNKVKISYIQIQIDILVTDGMGDIAEQQDDIMSLANSIPVLVHWFMSRRLIICNDFEGAKRTNGEAVTTRRDEVEHTVDVIFDHPRWPTYWLTIGRRRSPICEFCSVVPTKRLLTSDHLRRESLFTDWSSTRSGKHQLRRSDNSTATSSADVPRWARQYRYAGNYAITGIFWRHRRSVFPHQTKLAYLLCWKLEGHCVC